MWTTIVAIEMLGLICLASELSIMLKKKDPRYHIVGYFGAFCAVAGSMVYAKFII